MNGIIDVTWNLETYENTTLIHYFGLVRYYAVCVGTKEQVLAAWNTHDGNPNLDVLLKDMKPLFPSVRVPEMNMWNGVETSPSDRFYSDVHEFCETTICTATRTNDVKLRLVDKDKYGFYTPNMIQVKTPDGTYGAPVGASNTAFGVLTRIYDIYDHRTTSLLFAFRTVDNYYGVVNFDSNKYTSGLWFATAENSQHIFDWLDNVEQPDPDNPYAPGGESYPSNPADGSWVVVSQPVEFAERPQVSLGDSGFLSIWIPTEEQIKDLAKYMWNSNPFTGSFWQKMVSSPLDLVFGLYLMPIHYDHDSPHHNASVVLGYINTNIRMDYSDNQFFEVDMGSLNIDKFSGSYLDYAPYTKLSIYLPYIGIKELNINEFMGGTISLKYIIDSATGTCIAMIKNDESVVYHFAGNCASAIPITSIQTQQAVQNAISTCFGMMSVPIAAATGSELAMVAGEMATAASTAKTAMSKPEIMRSGHVGGTAGIMDIQYPYIIRTTPRIAMPERQQAYTGYPSFMTEQLIDLEGYTEVEVIHLHGLSCTDAEVAEIDELLKKGVIF